VFFLVSADDPTLQNIIFYELFSENSYFYIKCAKRVFFVHEKSFTPRRRSRQYKPLNAQKHLRARNINNIFSIIDSKN
jgi:hypothetical protein